MASSIAALTSASPPCPWPKRAGLLESAFYWWFMPAGLAGWFFPI